MKLSEYLNHLQQILADHGDLDVKGYNHGSGVLGANRDAAVPEVAHQANLRPRERTDRFYNKYCDQPEQKGFKVVKVS